MLFQRRETPPPLKRYNFYKRYLRRDFAFRCAYCLIHEAHFGGLRNFHVDHFRPKSRPEFRHLALVYSNLYYACGICNIFKGEHWPTAEDVGAGLYFVDPCQENAYETHLAIHEENGELRALTRAGEYSIAHIRLNREQLKRHRRRQTEVRKKVAELRSLIERPGLPAGYVSGVREIIGQIEREYLNPAPPYEVEDLA
jgi:uncharacterized protein (TIGR02646 family)